MGGLTGFLIEDAYLKIPVQPLVRFSELTAVSAWSPAYLACSGEQFRFLRNGASQTLALCTFKEMRILAVENKLFVLAALTNQRAVPV